jgi:hypothetical protein
MMWIVERFLKIMYPKRPKLEYADSANSLFNSYKSVFDCDHWVLSEEEYYYYTGKEYKKIEGIIYVLDMNSKIGDERVATPPGNVYLKTSQKLKMIL